MKKVATLEIWIDETMEDAQECMNDVIKTAKGHEYCCDGTVDIRIIKENN